MVMSSCRTDLQGFDWIDLRLGTDHISDPWDIHFSELNRCRKESLIPQKHWRNWKKEHVGSEPSDTRTMLFC